MERLTPLSAAFLQAEDEDTRTSMAISSTAVFEGPAPTHEEFLAHIAERLPLVPRYRQRIQTVPLDLAAPVWVDDPTMDVGWHVRRTALPAPGGPAELHRLIARVMTQRMDRSRPLWEYWVAEGLPGGRWAVLQKVHHAVVDGVSGTELYSVFFDPSRAGRAPVADNWVPRSAPSPVSMTAAALRELALTPAVGLRAVGAVARSPRTLARSSVRAVQGALSLSGAALPTAASSLSGPMGQQRRYASCQIGLDEVRTIRRALGGSVNDVALAAISGAFRELLLSRGEEPDAHAVRTLVPVSVRAPGEEAILDNRVSLMLPYLPVDLADPVERLTSVRQRLAEATAAGGPEAGVALTSIAAYGPFLPVALGVRLAFHLPQRQLVTVTTNVRGPSAPVYALGRRCEQIFPYVPIADRVRIGVSIFSYAGTLSFGVTGDYDTVPDIDVLCDAIVEATVELLHAAHGT